MVTLLAHEWLERHGGAEQVFSALQTIFPESRRYCLWNDDPGRFAGVEQSWLAQTFLRRHKALAFPFFNYTWRRVGLRDIDRVVVSSHSFAHHLAATAASRGIKSYAYIHTPARYLWDAANDQRGRVPTPRLIRKLFQTVDRRAVSGEVNFAANSEFVRERVRRAWGVDSRVIYPPVRVEELQSQDDWRNKVTSVAETHVLNGLPKEFVLAASRFVPYKRIDVAIKVGELLGLPVLIAGKGPDESRLREAARASRTPVHFVCAPSTELLLSLYQSASLFVFMGVEDFGIMPVEAMALGTPVLANEAGGASESVRLLGGGVTCTPDSPDLLKYAMEALAVDMSKAVVRVREFSIHEFQRKIEEWAC